MRGLRERHDVAILSFVNPQEPYDVESVREICRVVDVVPRIVFNPTRSRAIAAYLHASPRSQVDTYSRAFAGRLSAEIRTGCYDAIVASQMGTIEYGLQATGLPRVLDEIELGGFRDKGLEQPSTLRQIRRGLTWAKLTRYLRNLLPRYDAVTTASSIEMKHVLSVVPKYSGLHVVPNGVDTVRLRPNPATRDAGSLIYNGALTFGANYDAMRYFVGDIWPLILSSWQDNLSTCVPVPSLRITGSAKGVDLAPFGSPGVTFTGYVDDVAHEVSSASVCVVPLRVGGGTRLKILEAMALGTPVVATSKGAEGLDVTHGENILIADKPKDFAEHVLHLLSDDDRCRQIARSARTLVEARYDWGMIGQQFCNLVESVAAQKTVESSA